ncbi:MAG: DoxX family protein [candidate division Zixibacteria bacterium]
MILTFLNKYRDVGLLILRVGFGIMFIFHGAPKLFGGPERWGKLGAAMGNFGIDFLPAFWGFMASFSEFFGGILLILGLFFRPACILLTLTMIVAAGFHIGRGDGFLGASRAIENGIVFLSLILIGPGKVSLDKRLSRDRDNNT